MRKFSRKVSIALMVALVGLSPVVGRAQTQTRMGDQQMSALMVRLVQRTDTFSTSLDRALNRTMVSGNVTSEQMRSNVSDLQRSIILLRDDYNARRATATEARDVLNQAKGIDNIIRQNRLGTQTENSWADLRYELDQLAAAYNINWNWNDSGNYSSSGPIKTGPYNQGTYGRNALTGTFALDVSRSDDPRTAAEAAVRGSSTRNRQRALDDLTARLEAADRMAIDRQGQSVTIESSRAPQVTFLADGSVRTEQDQNGETVQVRANLSGDRLTISSTGSSTGSSSVARANDYEVTFEPFNNGRSLRVTRRISSEYTYRPVTVQSVYDKTSDVAQLDPNSSNSGSNTGQTTDDYLIPDNVVLMGLLNTDLNTKTVHENDRFTLTVRTPAQYAGAVIEGHITGVQRSGRVTGKSAMTFNFDTIRLRDGSSYRFAGVVESVRTQGGDEVKVNNEGNVQTSDGRGTTTAKRAAIGTGIGAIIGAIAGGGKGAAIGAAVGAGAGAGSVYVQGKDDLELPNGTEIRLRSSSPRGFSDNR